ncbi:MAG TPA: glycosyltransferase family 1 protein [Planctomycetota bacterium]|nr:glycosyltransferase family 1 protein [Planctomycetota bacterium]
MDHVAGMLLGEIAAGHCGGVSAEMLSPPFQRRLTRVPVLGKPRFAFNADRLLNRMRDLPKYLGKRRDEFDCFHICDHAYANVVHTLPAERTGVFCHDLDTFRCLFEPEKERRPRWFKTMMRRVLKGLQKAAIVFHTTSEIRRQILAHGIVDEASVICAPYGVSSVFSPRDDPDRPEAAVLEKLGGAPYLLHVGSCIRRKRIDVLLDVFGAMRAQHRGVRLLQVGGEWSAEQREQIARLRLEPDVVHAGRQDQRVIAGLYRKAVATLLPSDAEGFGLPVIEALACGCAVVASDIPPLMEVSGGAALHCPVGEVEKWAATLDKLISDPAFAPARGVRLKRASEFSWLAHARTICGAYRKMC